MEKTQKTRKIRTLAQYDAALKQAHAILDAITYFGSHEGREKVSWPSFGRLQLAENIVHMAALGACTYMSSLRLRMKDIRQYDKESGRPDHLLHVVNAGED